MRVLFAEDEQDLNRIVTKRLTAEGYAVDSCFDGTQAWEFAQQAVYDAAIFDVMMPGIDGFELLKKMRAAHLHTPVLFLTARDAIAERVHGLDIGAGDYIVKPFSFDELFARLRVLMREKTAVATNVFTVADLRIDVAGHTATRAGEPIPLSGREFSLLEYLIRHTGIVLTRNQIETHLYNYDYFGGSNVIDVYIRYLRKKIDDGRLPKLIHTVRGVGYVLRDETLTNRIDKQGNSKP